MKKFVPFIIVAAVLIVLLALAALGYHWLQNRGATQQSSSSGFSAVSKVLAPDFTVQDANGKSVSFSDYKGKPVVLNFWASWCPPCKSEMPDYQTMYQKYSEKGVVFMMIDMTDGERETVTTAKKFLADNKYTFPAYFDVDSIAANTFAITSIPRSVFIGRDGRIIRGYTGTLSAAEMEQSLQEILK